MAYRQKEYNYNDKLTKDQNLLMDKLYKMRMSGMAEAFENQLMNPNSGLESFETRFSEIINHEWSGRENKKFNRHLKHAAHQGGTFYFFFLVRNPSGNSFDHGKSRFRSSGFGKGPILRSSSNT